MSETVIQIEDLSKRYRLGVIGRKTLSADLNRRWAELRGKPDPLSKVTEVATTSNGSSKSSSSEEIWALKDISFEVKQGEVLGIIGRNGAGKSTLLKILSRVTAPTKGEVRVKGRIASLLEVGTGFHPELTGRENIFLNGGILGMTKSEIRKRFDEIVEFAEIEKFIDTPVKRYSSGMYVRLAFAVAAHLEPEILIVDEVLAVGDAEFQKKCLGKMHDVASEGRTVLFVSHNMVAVQRLCQTGVLIEAGRILVHGDILRVTDAYLTGDRLLGLKWRASETKELPVYFEEVQIAVTGRQPALKLEIECNLRNNGIHKKAFVAFDICDSRKAPIMQAIPIEEPFLECRDEGRTLIKSIVHLPALVPGTYRVSCWIGSHYTQTIDWVKQVVAFEVVDFPVANRTVPYSAHTGFMVPNSTVEATYL